MEKLSVDGLARCRWISTTLAMGALLGLAIARPAWSADAEPPAPAESNLVKQANAPISSVLQLRLQDSLLADFPGVRGLGNALTMSMTMPLPEYRLLPLPQLSLLTVPAATTLPDGSTGFGDVRFVDIAVIDAGHAILFGIGPTFVFPTASEPATGLGKWQVGPAAAAAFAPENWLVGFLAQQVFSFAGDRNRADTNALFLQPFLLYQLGNGWFLRSQPQMVFDWQSGRQTLPLDLGAGRVFAVGRQHVNCFLEPFWNVSRDGVAPRYGITFGISLLYPDFWRRS
jgi:hypothetical protein